MGQILIKQTIVLLDDEDALNLKDWLWHLHPAGKTIYARGYPRGQRKSGLHYMHRVISRPLANQEVDHKNGNGLDNRRENLRVCSRSLNNANRRSYVSKSSRYKGVSFETYTQRWRAEIQYKKKKFKLGRFDSEEDAREAYEKKAAELFGEFAYCSLHR